MQVVKKYLDKTSFRNPNPVNLNEKDLWLFKTHINTYVHEVKLYRFKKVFFLPEHIIVEKFKIWKGELINHYTESKIYVAKRFVKAAFRKTKKLSGKYLLVTDDWSFSYFHWTGDVLPKVYLVRDALKDHIVLLPENFKKYNYIVESMSLFNARIEYFSPNRNLSIEELLVPSPIGGSGVFNYDIINRLSSFIKTHPTVQANNTKCFDKIYISRGKAKHRKIINEDEVIALLSSMGFYILYAEDMTYVNQVKFFSTCKYLISLHGAGLTNELYLPDGAKVLEIRHPLDHLNNCYYLMAAALGIKYYYFISDAKDEDPHSANVSINISSFSKCVFQMIAKDQQVISN